jgi:nitrite reductase/ring-hydroxylating ferredoxin subunit
MPFVRALKIIDLPPGGKKIIEMKGIEIALFSSGQNICAVSNICPHYGGSLGEGVFTGETVVCPLHFWEFSVVTGRSTNQPAYRIESYPVKVDKEWIWINLPEEALEE